MPRRHASIGTPTAQVHILKVTDLTAHMFSSTLPSSSAAKPTEYQKPAMLAGGVAKPTAPTTIDNSTARITVQIIDILNLGGTRDSPFDIVLITLTQIPRLVLVNPNTEIRLMKKRWIKACMEAAKWRQVCTIWRQCHEEHIVVRGNAGQVAATASWEPHW